MLLPSRLTPASVSIAASGRPPMTGTTLRARASGRRQGRPNVPSYCQVTYNSVATANASSTCNTIITVTAESGSAGVALR